MPEARAAALLEARRARREQECGDVHPRHGQAKPGHRNGCDGGHEADEKQAHVVATRDSALRVRFRQTCPVESRQAQVSLLRWLRRQLAQREGIRERIEAAVAHDDPGELRRLVGALDFSEAQRRHVLGLVEGWERARDAEQR